MSKIIKTVAYEIEQKSKKRIKIKCKGCRYRTTRSGYLGFKSICVVGHEILIDKRLNDYSSNCQDREE